MKIHILTAAALLLSTSLSQAETVHTKTFVQTQDIEGVNQINFSEFDINEDGLYAKSEVGEKLFYVFDRDNNKVIDNIEWNNRSLYTIIPMEKEVYRFVDYNDDGYTDLSSYNYRAFYQESGLIRFDENKNGLSAAEFIETGFQELDDNDNNIIELDEWKEAYTEMTKPKNAEQERYN
ncbi:MAG: hypothetical protein CBB87_04850 [Micavibrio sp. TMED27]|nr:hypothetical protein [Micavibrio sp.]OUT91361.1 MAG: hypothetical protein CBB87_04850 [Micavibrio sp. TMED27]|tara:strand:+ start:4761 stop:5294 length:534 start_codon:yes stop_codon:yes gene_type:complete